MANIIINKGETNFICITVSERQEIQDPYYLFVLRSKFNSDEYRYFNSVDLSQNKIRYNRFRTDETTTPDNTLNEVELYTGEWTYSVYESVTQTLDIEQTTKRILETGLCIVLDENYK